MAIFDQEHRPPEADETDAAYGVVRAAIGAVPVVGPAAVELLQRVIAPPLARRLQEWMSEVGVALRRLEAERDVDIDDLSKNQAFIDAVLSATQAVIRTSQSRKREAFRSIVLNAALPGSPDVTEQQIFLSMTDRFTDRHLALLFLFHSPKKWRTPDGKPLRPKPAATGRTLLWEAFPDAEQNQALYDLLWSELRSAGLVRTPNIDNGPEGPILDVKRVTDFGRQYVAFISNPLSS